MVDLHTTFDLLGSITHFIYSQRQSQGQSTSTTTLSVNTQEPVLIIPRVINQEKGGAVIFVWHDVHKDQPGVFVTNFGIYELETQKHSLIYTYENKVKVVSCSVNQERTLLAFSIQRPRESSGDRKTKDVYEAFLAQLQSVDKVIFSLNMERSTFVKVQFLYFDQQASQGRESAMLVFLHKESIGLYKVRMARIGDRGMMMSGQPSTEQIVGKFVWCQWDFQNQQLHLIRNIRGEKRSEQKVQRVSTLQFYPNTKFENMIDVPINFPFPSIRTVDRPRYGDIPLHPGIPDVTLNVSVLTQLNGTFCICYHNLNVQGKKKTGNPSPNEVQDVEYYISLVHHVKTLYGCVPNVAKEIVMQKRLVFSWIGTYLAVLLPGCFIHLLNVSPNFEPCHHIMLHDHKMNLRDPIDMSVSRPTSVKFLMDDARDPQGSPNPELAVKSSPSPALQSSGHHSLSLKSTPSPALSMSSWTPQPVVSIFSSQCATMKTLLLCQSSARESGQMTQNLYDYRSGCMMKLVINPDALVEYFCHAYWQTQMAILHYFILHNKDLYTLSSLFRCMGENPTNPELNILITEYLIASVYAEMKKQVDREILNLLPFTSIQTLRGQFEKRPTEERLAHMSYLSMEIVDLNKKMGKDSKGRSQENFWGNLSSRIRQRHSEMLPKFTYDIVMRVYHMTEKEETPGKTQSLWYAMLNNDSFFDGVFTLKATELPAALKRQRLKSDSSGKSEETSGRRSKTEAVLGPAPLFLQTPIYHDSSIFRRRISVQTEKLLTNHLSKYLKKTSHSRSVNVAKEFLACEARVTQQLCHLIWSLRSEFMPDYLDECLLPNLQEPGTDEEYELFQLFEQFYMVVGDLGFPMPPGFSSFFTALGFKCLDLHLFLQYVDNHVLILTPDFILQLLKDLDNDEDREVVKIKYSIISRLPPQFSKECFERWNHPLILQRKSQEQISTILLQGMDMPEAGVEGKARAPSADSGTFQPLSALKKHLDAVITNIPANRPVNIDPGLLEKMSLYNTEKTTSLDMSSVDF